MKLKNDKLTLQFSEFGGTLTSIKDVDSVEYLWQGNPEYWSGQAPVLFPICGSVRNNQTIYADGTKGVIPRHGLVRKENFKLEQLNEDSVIFSIRATDKMIENYPYRFELRIIYTLRDSTVRTTYEITNHGTKNAMPFFIGGHPGFNCPLLEGDEYEDFYLEFDEEETCSVPKSFPENGLLDLLDRTPFLDRQKHLYLDYSIFAHDAVTLDKLKSRSVSLRSSKHTKGLRLDFTDYPYLIIWSTPNKSPFIALEPWSGLSTSLEESDYFEEKLNVGFVKPGETATKYFDVTIL